MLNGAFGQSATGDEVVVRVGFAVACLVALVIVWAGPQTQADSSPQKLTVCPPDA
jgi:hypothetical protein